MIGRICKRGVPLVLTPLLLAAECSQARVVVDGYNSNLGVAIGSTSTSTFTVRNTGDYAVRLGEISSAAVGLSPPFSLAGSTCSTGMVLEKKFDFCTLSIAFTPVEVGQYEQTVRVTWNWEESGVPDRISSAPVTASALPPLRVIGSGKLSGVPVGTSRDVSYALSNRSNFGLQLGNLTAQGLGLQAPFSVAGGTCTSGQPLELEESCTLLVRFTPTSAGTFNDTLQVAYVWQYGGGRQLSESAQLTASSLPEVTLTRTANLTPSVPVGSTVVETITITNAGGEVATLGPVNSAALGLAPPFSHVGGSCVSGLDLGPAAESCTIAVRYTPTVAGTYYDQLNVTYSWPGTATQALSTRLFAGAVSVNPGNCYEHGCAPGQVCTEVTSSEPRVGMCVEVPAPPPGCMAPCVWEARKNCLPAMGACVQEQTPETQSSCDDRTGWSTTVSNTYDGVFRTLATEIHKDGLTCFSEHIRHIPGWSPNAGSFSDGTRPIAVSTSAIGSVARSVWCGPYQNAIDVPPGTPAYEEAPSSQCSAWWAQYLDWTQCRSVATGTCSAP